MLLNTEISKVLLIGQSIAIYAWLTTLSPLAVTDTYYSVYLLCGIAGLVCLYINYKNRKSVFGGGTVILTLLVA